MGVEFGEVHPGTFRLRVRDGLVACPRLSEVDIACCLECGQLVRLEGRPEVRVVCARRMRGVGGDQLDDMAWDV